MRQCIAGVPLPTTPRQCSSVLQEFHRHAPRQCGSVPQEFHCPQPLGSAAVYRRSTTAHCPKAVWHCTKTRVAPSGRGAGCPQGPGQQPSGTRERGGPLPQVQNTLHTACGSTHSPPGLHFSACKTISAIAFWQRRLGHTTPHHTKQHNTTQQNTLHHTTFCATSCSRRTAAHSPTQQAQEAGQGLKWNAGHRLCTASGILTIKCNVDDCPGAEVVRWCCAHGERGLGCKRNGKCKRKIVRGWPRMLVTWAKFVKHAGVYHAKTLQIWKSLDHLRPMYS